MADAIKSQVRAPTPGRTVVFVIGGPGSGKGTQCSKIAKQFGFAHLSVDDLLREEAKEDTLRGMFTKHLINEGKHVTSELIVDLLLKPILHGGNDKILVDGFPRNEEDRQGYERVAYAWLHHACFQIGIELEFVLFIDCPKEELERRILHRNQGRDDDNIDTIRKRFQVFQESTLPVVQYYDNLGKLRRVDGAKSPDAVFEDVKAIFAELNIPQANQGSTSASRRVQRNPLVCSVL